MNPRKRIRFLVFPRNLRIALEAWRRGIPWLHLARQGKTVVMKGTKIPLGELPRPLPEGISLFVGLLSPFGFSLRLSDNQGKKAILLDTGEVRLWLDGADVTGMAQEVFGEQEYGVSISRGSLLIGIGMNVATTALYFAKEPSVKRVVGFEPSRSAIERAERNFAVNLEIAKKIEVRPYALGNANGKAYLQIVPGRSGSSSITERDGLQAGDLHLIPIEVRDADVELRSLLAETAEDQQVILKVDCEGSEREVFRSLTVDTLLRIDVILLEWHQPEILAEISQKLEELAFRLLVRRIEKSRGMLYAFRDESNRAHGGKPVFPSVLAGG